MLSGIIIADDLCHEAPSHTINISSSEYSLDTRPSTHDYYAGKMIGKNESKHGQA